MSQTTSITCRPVFSAISPRRMPSNGLLPSLKVRCRRVSGIESMNMYFSGSARSFSRTAGSAKFASFRSRGTSGPTKAFQSLHRSK